MADWDISSPDDSGIVSQFPANERAARAAVMANFGVEHHEEDDANIGKHELVTLLDQGSDPTIPAGQVGIYNVGGVLRTRSGAGTPVAADAFPAGTKMVFRQASAPTGWTQDTSANDRVLRVVSGPGGGVGGSWTISGLSHQHNHWMDHTHESPVRILDLVAGQGSDSADVWQAGGNTPAFGLGPSRAGIVARGMDTSQADMTTQTALTSGASQQSTGVASVTGVSSDGTWRPAYLDVIVASKN